MKRTHVIGLAFVTALMLSVVGASAASAALPEILNGGKELVKKGFTSKLTSATAVLETEKGRKVTCTGATNKGTLTGPKTDTVTIIFTGCESLGLKCKGVKPAAKNSGEIIVNALSELVYINKANKEVGIDLKPSEALFTEFECGGLETLKVRGSVIGKITPVNKVVTPPETFTLTFTQAKGIQSPSEYENEKSEKIKDILETEGTGLETFPFERSGQSGTASLLFEEPAEIDA